MRALLLMTLTTVAAAVPACTARGVPYRFAGPMVSAVSLDDVAEHGGQRRRRVYDDGVLAPTRIVDVPGAPGGVEVPGGAAIHGGPRGTVTRDDVAVFPEPHRQPKADDGDAVVDLTASTDVAALRALVGSRDGRSDVTFALDAAAALRGAPDDALPGSATLDGPSLVELARGRDALLDARLTERTAAPGDLLVFDRVVDGEPASLVAVVLERDGRGVMEMLYLARGVVRRGFVDPTRPTVKRDLDGRIVNTFLRHGTNYPPKGTRYLAGELLVHVVPWRDL